MFTQLPKTEIDVGTMGNASSGDILYDGGEKINQNSTSIFNAFGDQRIYDSGLATQSQTIHATGYYQKVSSYDFRTPLAMGTMWDVDVSTGAANPTLAQGRAGESIEFINSNGTCSVSRPIVIQPTGGTFVGIQGGLTITQPFCKVVCWCIRNENGASVWDYSLETLFASTEVPIDVTQAISVVDGAKIDIAHISEYRSIKLLITAMSLDGTKVRQSESNILVTTVPKAVYSTEYAVLRVGNSNEDDEIVDIKYDISLADTVQMTVTSKYPNMRIAVKSIATQRVGTA